MQLQNYRQREKVTASVHSKTDYPFDYFFERTACSQVEGKEEEEEEVGDSSPEDSDPEHTSPDSEQVPSSSPQGDSSCISET